jgi:SSS family solute:Na+ symporter
MNTLPILDWAVMGVYFAAILLVGFYASGKQDSTRDYFIGDRSLPWWAVALSIVATETSAVTFIGVPGMAYRGDWYLLELVSGFLLGRVFLSFFFLRIFYRFDILTVYGYLEKRYGDLTRVIAAMFFLMGRVVASGVRLFAACLAVHIATQLSIELAIVLLGFFAVGYTLIGGIRSVVWTDVILGLTFTIGGLVAVIFLLQDAGGEGALSVSNSDVLDKLRVFYAGVPPATEAGGAPQAASSWAAFFASDHPFLIAAFGGFFLTLATHGIDQDNVQRMLSCADEREGIKSLLASAAVILPVMVLFLAIGTLLWYTHAAHPELKPELPAGAIGNPSDYYFPHFIANHLPPGVRGFVFAGIFAAALSSLTSVMNALAATTVADFYEPFIKQRSTDTHYLRAARVFTVLWGLALMGLAWFFIGSDESIFTLALKVLTYFYGAILGVFLLGIFTRRGSVLSTTVGMLAGVAAVLLVQLRVFLGEPGSAPPTLERALQSLPPDFTGAIKEFVPVLAWPLWVVLGTAVSFGIGLLGNQVVARQGRTLGQREQAN